MLSVEQWAAQRSICCHIDPRRRGGEQLVEEPSKPG
jgi:hypothetical protein